MNILYVHGFGSHYDPEHEKIKALETLGTVVGINVDYCKGYDRVSGRIYDAIMEEQVDLIVGTSMGGYMAAQMGSQCGVPFVSLNPAIKPSESLQKWVGTFIDYAGNDRCLTELVVASYPDIVQTGAGLVMVDSGDEVLRAQDTMDLLENIFQVEWFTGGNHGFTHMEAALPKINTFFKEQTKEDK